MSIFNRRESLWIDSETDQTSTSSTASETTSINRKTSPSGLAQPSNTECCFICSILPSLSKINCCSKHLALLTRASHGNTPSQINNRPQSERHCQPHCSTWQRRYRYRSLSSGLQPRRKKRSITLTSFVRIKP